MRLFLLLFLILDLLHAKKIEASYDVSYGVFSSLGVADAKFESFDDGSYVIEVSAKATGLAKLLSGGRVETFSSYGIIKDDRLVPLKYSKTRSTSSKSTTRIYTFDHQNRAVIKESIKRDSYKKEPNEFYASDDILSLFFNSSLFLKERKDHIAYAIGANKDDGKVEILFPQDGDLKKARKLLRSDGDLVIKVVLNEKIFSSSRDELLISLDEDGISSRAILEDVLLFGDIVGTKRD